MAAAQTVSQRAQPLSARANVASVPATPPTPYIEEIYETIPAIDEVYYDFETEEEEWRIKNNIREFKQNRSALKRKYHYKANDLITINK